MNELEILGILTEAADSLPDGMLKNVINNIVNNDTDDDTFTNAIQNMANKQFNTPVEAIAFFSHCVVNTCLSY